MTRLAGLRASLAAWWKARAPGERRTLALGALVLAPVLLVFGVVLPAKERIARLDARVLVLDRQLGEMRSMQAALKSAAPATLAAEGPDANAGALPARLDAELSTLPGFRGNARAEGEGIDLAIESAPFDALLVWLERTQKRERLFPAEVRLNALAEAGRVGGRIRLVRGGSG